MLGSLCYCYANLDCISGYFFLPIKNVIFFLLLLFLFIIWAMMVIGTREKIYEIEININEVILLMY